MTLDLISRAEARIAEHEAALAKLREQALEHEGDIVALNMFIEMAKELAGDEIDLSFLGTEPQPSPAAQTDTTAPKPLPDASDTTADALEQPAEAKTVDQGPLSNGSGGVQDRSESTPPTSSPSLHISDLPEGGENEVEATETEAPFNHPADPPRSEVATREAAVAGASDPTTPTPVTLTRKIVRKSVKREIFERCHAEHPDWPVKLIVEHTGLPKGTVTGYAAKLGIKMPSLAEYEAAQRAKTTEALKAPAPAEPPSAPTAGPAIEPKPYHLTHRPVLKAKAGTKFYLRDRATGHYLHCSVTLNKSGTPLLTTEKAYAWQGTEAHMLAVRKKLPATIDFLEQVVEKEPVRA